MNYDVIGDIHGHSDKLTALLGKMGYRHRAGAWRHPDRNAIFVGDFIDRGPGQLETIDVVRGMVDAGTALAVMGNHEFNAVAWHMPDPDAIGEHLRRRTPDNRNQHKAFLDAAEHDPALHRDVLDWFLTLPLWLDLPGLRVVHACWHPGYMAEIEPLLKPGRRIDRALVLAASRRGSIEYRVVEALLKGPEIELPAGYAFRDKGGKLRHHARIRWWKRDAVTYRDVGIVEPGGCELPDVPIAGDAPIGYDGDKPVFFGHYWFNGIPKPSARRAACVDYSAGKGGPLIAYRWNGEPELRADGFVST